MKVYEFGKDHRKTFAMFQCTAEPGWVFKASAEAVARDYHVFLFIADGHDELGTTFVSVEKYASDAAVYLREKGIRHLDGLYGVSMGGDECDFRFVRHDTDAGDGWDRSKSI